MAAEHSREANDLVLSATRDFEQFNRRQGIISTSSLLTTGLASIAGLTAVPILFPLVAGIGAVAALTGKQLASEKRQTLEGLIHKYRGVIDPSVLAQAERALAQSAPRTESGPASEEKATADHTTDRADS